MTTVIWILVTFLTPPTDGRTLQAFYDRIRPFRGGWRAAVTVGDEESGSLTAALLSWLLGVTVVYGALFGTGYFLYGNVGAASLCAVLVVGAAVWLFRLLPRVGFE